MSNEGEEGLGYTILYYNYIRSTRGMLLVASRLLHYMGSRDLCLGSLFAGYNRAQGLLGASYIVSQEAGISRTHEYNL